jgi:hypothetical protein
LLGAATLITISTPPTLVRRSPLIRCGVEAQTCRNRPKEASLSRP